MVPYLKFITSLGWFGEFDICESLGSGDDPGDGDHVGVEEEVWQGRDVQACVQWRSAWWT